MLSVDTTSLAIA